MGTYRLILAVAVMLTHYELFATWSVLPGRVAVVSFFLISGFVMTGLIRNHYHGTDRITSFYVDRVARLYPQFLVYVLLAFYIAQLGHPTTISTLALNLLMVPLGFLMWSDMLLITPSWSLGLEAMFYLVFPFIILYNQRAVAAVLSVAVFAGSYVGILHSDAFGYFLLPGTLFIFLLGSWMYDARLRSMPWSATVALAASAGACAIALIAPSYVHVATVPLGILIGIPVIWLLRKPIGGWFDQWAGHLSYGLFLGHVPVLLLANHYDLRNYTLGMIVVSFALAGATYLLVEKPVLAWRRRWRSQSDRDLKFITSSSRTAPRSALPTE